MVKRPCQLKLPPAAGFQARAAGKLDDSAEAIGGCTVSECCGPPKNESEKCDERIEGIEEQNRVRLRLVLPCVGYGDQALILIRRADVVHLRNPKRIESRSALRTGIKQARDLGLVGIVQIRKCPARADHAVQRELVADAHIPGIAENRSHGRNH